MSILSSRIFLILFIVLLPFMSLFAQIETQVGEQKESAPVRFSQSLSPEFSLKIDQTMNFYGRVQINNEILQIGDKCYLGDSFKLAEFSEADLQISLENTSNDEDLEILVFSGKPGNADFSYAYNK